MKKWIAVLMTLCLMAGTCALAETAGTDASAEDVQTEEETVETEEDSFLSWVDQELDKLTDAVSEGWDKATDAVVSGWDWLTEKSAEWIDKAEAYMKEKEWDKKVEDAWNTLKEGASKQGQVAKETLEDAYATVKEWIEQTGEDADREISEAVDGVAGAAGVAEARFSSWCRRMEDYMEQKADLVTDAVRDAWTVIKEGASEADEAARKKLDQAYETVLEWLKTDETGEGAEMVMELEEIMV